MKKIFFNINYKGVCNFSEKINKIEEALTDFNDAIKLDDQEGRFFKARADLYKSSH